jgi:hypothetical protein
MRGVCGGNGSAGLWGASGEGLSRWAAPRCAGHQTSAAVLPPWGALGGKGAGRDPGALDAQYLRARRVLGTVRVAGARAHLVVHLKSSVMLRCGG